MDGVVAVVRDVAAGGEKLGGRTPTRVVVAGGRAVVGGRLAARYWGASYDCIIETFARRTCCAADGAGPIARGTIRATFAIFISRRGVTIAANVVLSAKSR